MSIVSDLVAAKTMLAGDAARLRALLDIPPTVSVGFFQSAVPADADTVARYLFVEAATFPADFLGSLGHVETLPTADATLDVQRNGASIGTILIDIDGAVTFETTGGASPPARGSGSAAGDVRVNANGERLAGPIDNQGGVLDIRGDLTMLPDKSGSVSLLLTPRRSDDQVLQRALATIGTAEGGGWRVNWQTPPR